jgi:hypothetical protein
MHVATFKHNGEAHLRAGVHAPGAVMQHVYETNQLSWFLGKGRLQPLAHPPAQCKEAYHMVANETAMTQRIFVFMNFSLLLACLYLCHLRYVEM